MDTSAHVVSSAIAANSKHVPYEKDAVLVLGGSPPGRGQKPSKSKNNNQKFGHIWKFRLCTKRCCSGKNIGGGERAVPVGGSAK